MEHKYKVGDKVWKAEANDSFQQEVLALMDMGGNPFYRITWGINSITISEKLIFDTKEECERHRLETFKSILDENGKLDEAKLAARRPPKEPIPDDGKVRVVYNADWGGFGLSDEAIKWLKEHGLEFEDEDDIPRHNKLLVQCVHELGSKADGKYSDLGLWVLSGNRYRIDEYDGKETVIEPDNEDWITVEFMTEQELNKACDWLEFNAGGYLGLIHEELMACATLHTNKMIKDFRKAMGAVVKESLTPELTWQDMAKIADIFGHTSRLTRDGMTRSPEDFYSETLKRFKEIKED